MKAVEVLKMLKSKIDAASQNNCNYAIETSDIEAINKALNMPVVNVRYLLIEWINGNPVIDGCLHFNTKDKCLEYWEQLPKMAGVTYTICESHNAR